MTVDEIFEMACSATLDTEGRVLTKIPGDPGEETYWGISRRYWKSWVGWQYIDKYKNNGRIPEKLAVSLIPAVKKFYRTNFWDRMGGDEVAKISPNVAIELFDTSVNLDVMDAVRFMQTALNMQNIGGSTYPDIVVDGRNGKNTLNTLKRYLTYSPGCFTDNEKILLNCMNGEQYIYYKNNPRHEAFRGWFRRV
jgi:lysozyme family protein